MGATWDGLGEPPIGQHRIVAGDDGNALKQEWRGKRLGWQRVLDNHVHDACLTPRVGDIKYVDGVEYTCYGTGWVTEGKVVAGTPSPAARLETDSAKRKDVPLYSGVIRYFPDALAEVARLSKAGNDKHNPGEPLHWSRGKSDDHLDCLARHLAEAGTLDSDNFYHDVKIAWRALTNLQLLLERERGLPISPGSKA